MKASCEYGHERRAMQFDHGSQAFRCSCGRALTPTAIEGATPPEYRRSTHPLGMVLQAMADFEIEGVLTSDDRLKIEYPRPSLTR
jgi:hypothetical protein